MNVEFKPYQRYKESGAPWLGKVPEHWTVKPNRGLFCERNIKNRINEELLSVTIKRGVLKQTDLIANTSKKDSSNNDKSKYKLVLPGDIVYNKMRMWQGAVGSSLFQGIVSHAYIVLIPKSKAKSWYYHYLFKTPLYIKESYRYSYGICDDQLSLRYKDFKLICSPVPPIDEQEKIVTFIKSINGKINRYIKGKKQLIELLKEQKKAIINASVTGQIDLRNWKLGMPDSELKPYPKYKDSGVEWMREIPEEWEIRKLKHLAKIVLGKMLKPTPSNGYFLKFYLRAANIQWFAPDLKNAYKMWFSKNEMKRFRITKNDLLVSEGGEVGRACIWKNEIEECYIQNSVHKITALNKILPFFLFCQFYITGKSGFLRSIVNCVSIAHLTFEKLINITFLHPPLDEQSKICEYMQHRISKIDKSIKQIQREIDLIKEYRIRLISDAVTGKIDVRDMTFSINDEETEEFDELDSCEEMEDTGEEISDIEEEEYAQV